MLMNEAPKSGNALMKRVDPAKKELSRQQVEILGEITTVITSTLDLRSVLQILMETADRLLPYAAIMIFLKNPKDGTLERVTCWNIDEQEWRNRKLRATPRISRVVLETGRPVVVKDVQTDPRAVDPEFFRASHLHSYVGVPLFAKGEAIGVLSFLTREEYSFSGAEIDFLVTLGGQAAIAIHHSQLYEQLQTRNDALATLYSLAAEVNRSFDLDTMLRAAIERITAVFHFDATGIYFLNQESEIIERRASFEAITGILGAAHNLKPGEGLVGKVLATGEAIFFADVEVEPRYRLESHSHATMRGGYKYLGLLPINSRLRTIGVLASVGREPRVLDDSEIGLLGTITNQIGVAFENAVLLQDTKAKANQLSALYSLATGLNESLDLGETVRNGLVKGLNMFAFDAARIYLYDPRRKQLVLGAHEGFPSGFVISPTYDPTEGFVGRAYTTSEPLLFEDIQSDPVFKSAAQKRVMLQAGFRSQFFVPIRVRGRNIGVMNFVNREPHRFSPTEVEMIHSIAAHLGVAVEHARLFGEAGEQARELESLVKVNSDIAALLDRDVLLPRIAEEARKVLNVTVVTFRLIAGVSTHRVAHAGREVDGRTPLVLPVDRGLSGAIIQQNQVIQIRDIVNSGNVSDDIRRQALERGHFSFLGVPLRLQDRIIGTLSCYTEEERDFQAHEINLMTAFASQATIAIENANLFTEIKTKAVQLEQVNADLQAANRAKSDFMGAMSHELRTPLHVIMGYAELLLDGLGGSVTEIQVRALETVRHHSQALLRLINNVLTLTRIEANKMAVNVSTRPLKETLEHVRGYVEQLNRKNRLDIIWRVEHPLPALTTDHPKLEEILQNIIGNAYKFTPAGRIEISVRSGAGGGPVEFGVTDTGIGIRDGELDRIFNEFHQSHDAHTGNQEGVGLGLSIVKKYLNLMEGDIKVESKPGAGTVFTFTLPGLTEATSENARGTD